VTANDPIVQRLMSHHPRVITLGLERIERLLLRLGSPERKLPPLIHVAGTNGKGSLVAYLRAIAEAAETIQPEMLEEDAANSEKTSSLV
jgi:dihydrofolate synthase/folylpolyglutamate synthase